MAKFTVKDPPEFSTEMRMLETNDPGHANVFNPLLAQLLNNDAFLKAVADAAKKHMENGEIHVTAQDKEEWYAKAEAAEATQSESGLMGAGDKQKLDGVAENAEVNQDAFSKVKVGNVTIVANGKTSTFALEAGDNITITADNATKKITIAADKNGGNANTLGGHQASHFASADHAHDGRYYTETEVNSLLAGKAASSHSHAYLPLSGGTIVNDGGITFSKLSYQEASCRLYFNNARKITTCFNTVVSSNSGVADPFIIQPVHDSTWSELCIGENMSITSGIDSSNNNGNRKFSIYPLIGNWYYLGSSSDYFNALYANTGTILTSDRKKKKDIKEFNEDFVEAFIMGLVPVSYMLKENESGRTHYGLIAQDVEELMDRLEMDSKDFAGFIKSPKYETTTEEIEVENEVIGEDGEKKIVKEKRQNIKSVLVENEYEYALRYEEFISPIIKMLQILNNKLDSQREEIGKLKTEIETLKTE